MRKVFILFTFSFIIAPSLPAQKLDFLGLTGISFGMTADEIKDKTVIIDSTSAYKKDTAAYLSNTRCHLYYRQTQSLQLSGFTAARIEYEFCDDELSYVFVYVNGETDVNNALATLKKTFPHLGCGKNIPVGQCKSMDASGYKMRIIVTIDQTKHAMNFVLIPKKAAK